MRISDWSSDVCSSDLHGVVVGNQPVVWRERLLDRVQRAGADVAEDDADRADHQSRQADVAVAIRIAGVLGFGSARGDCHGIPFRPAQRRRAGSTQRGLSRLADDGLRSEEHTSELQSLMRTSYAVLCLKKKTQK